MAGLIPLRIGRPVSRAIRSDNRLIAAEEAPDEHLEAFTEFNRQGPDQGTSYRSEIFFATPAQEQTARAYVAQLGGAHVLPAPIVTKIEALKGFYPAEDYHQDFLVHNPTYPYIVYNDLPKIAALKKVWPEYYRDQPVLLASR